MHGKGSVSCVRLKNNMEFLRIINIYIMLLT